MTVPFPAPRGPKQYQAHRVPPAGGGHDDSGWHPRDDFSRTLLDLAAVVPRDALKKATKEAERLRLFDLAEVNRRSTGTLAGPAAELRTALATYEEPAFTR